MATSKKIQNATTSAFINDLTTFTDQGDVRRLREALTEVGITARKTDRASLSEMYRKHCMPLPESWRDMTIGSLRKEAKSVGLQLANATKTELIESMQDRLRSRWSSKLEQMVRDETSRSKTKMQKMEQRSEAIFELVPTAASLKTDSREREVANKIIADYKEYTDAKVSFEERSDLVEFKKSVLPPNEGEKGGEIKIKNLPSRFGENGVVVNMIYQDAGSSFNLGNMPPVFWQGGRKPGHDFETWLGIFRAWMNASEADRTTEEKKRNLLILALGAKGFKLLRSIESEQAEMEPSIAALSNFFSPRETVARLRSK